MKTASINLLNLFINPTMIYTGSQKPFFQVIQQSVEINMKVKGVNLRLSMLMRNHFGRFGSYYDDQGNFVRHSSPLAFNLSLLIKDSKIWQIGNPTTFIDINLSSDIQIYSDVYINIDKSSLMVDPKSDKLMKLRHDSALGRINVKISHTTIEGGSFDMRAVHDLTISHCIFEGRFSKENPMDLMYIHRLLINNCTFRNHQKAKQLFRITGCSGKIVDVRVENAKMTEQILRIHVNTIAKANLLELKNIRILKTYSNVGIKISRNIDRTTFLQRCFESDRRCWRKT